MPLIEVEVLAQKPFSERYIIVTAGDLQAANAKELNAKVNRLVLHELAHEMYFGLDVQPREHQDEQIVDYLVNAIEAGQLKPPPVGPPAPKSLVRQPGVSYLPRAVSYALES